MERDKVLRSALAKRSAFALNIEQWVDVPILASEKVLRNRIRKFGCHDPASMEKAVAGTHPADHSELEQYHVLPCQHCGYLFPESTVVSQLGSSRVAGRSFVWSCEHCEADGGLCAEA